jgi:DNA-directed RNA polymerase specialized sigma24 family protein
MVTIAEYYKDKKLYRNSEAVLNYQTRLAKNAALQRLKKTNRQQQIDYLERELNAAFHEDSMPGAKSIVKGFNESVIKHTKKFLIENLENII